jgi:hypothetical protein
MKTILILVLALTLAGALNAIAQTTDSLALAQIKPEHGVLERLAGRWNTTIRVWPSEADSAGLTMRGRSETHMMLDGRFLIQQDSTRILNRLYNDFGVLGYDHLKGAYTMVWMDIQGTDMVNLSGAVNDSGNVLTMQGERVRGKNGGSELKLVYRSFDGNNRQLEFWEEKTAGKMRRTMQIVYKRGM